MTGIGHHQVADSLVQDAIDLSTRMLKILSIHARKYVFELLLTRGCICRSVSPPVTADLGDILPPYHEPSFAGHSCSDSMFAVLCPLVMTVGLTGTEIVSS
jgi:hypothetical protein